LGRNVKVLLAGLGQVETVVARILDERGHTVAIRVANDSSEPHWLGETHDLVIDRWPGAGWSGFTSWAVSACGDAFILTVVDGEPDEATVAALLAAGIDDVIARRALESLLGERILVVEHSIHRRSARTLAEAVTAPDMGVQHEQHELLRDLAEDLSTTLNSIGDAVIACDSEGAIRRMNPVAEKLTGWAFDEAKGRLLGDIFKIFDGHTRAPVENPVARVLRHGVVAPLGVHWLLARRDGTDLPIADSCAPIKRSDGHARGAVLVFRDVSAEHRARDLEEKTRRQLFVAERMASVGTLAAGAAHEINNPLAYVITNLDVALEEIRALGGRPASARLDGLEDMLREARDGAERVRLIVRGLKTFSRTEEEHRTVVELKTVLELATVMVANEIRHRATLVEDFGAVPLVEVDAGRLGQVFINLLINAAQALPDGHIATNEIRITTSTDAAGQAVVEIADTGPGIPSSVLERVFDPFFTTKAVGVGTGLGLSISRNIVNSIGGEISVKSEEGRGTTFRVVLPPAPVQQITSRTDSVNPAAPGGAAILVVDDEAALGKAFRRVLRGHDVTILTRANDALDLLATGKTFDVIFSDLMMPEMSGMEFFDACEHRFPETAERMVFVTGGAFTPEAKAFLARVPNERIEKPFDAEAVRALVHSLCKPRNIPAISGSVELRPAEDALDRRDDRSRRGSKLV
jgi:PAS domain S-box-containing protein